MRREFFCGLLALTLGLAGCASHSDANSSTSGAADNRLTSATVTFTTLQEGKDAKSGVDVQLLRGANELAADANATGTDYKDNTTTAPIVMAIKGPFTRADAQAGQLKLRLTPDGNDTWTFNARLALRFADNTQQNYAWSAVRLDEKQPERTLVMSGALQP